MAVGEFARLKIDEKNRVMREGEKLSLYQPIYYVEKYHLLIVNEGDFNRLFWTGNLVGYQVIMETEQHGDSSKMVKSGIVGAVVGGAVGAGIGILATMPREKVKRAGVRIFHNHSGSRRVTRDEQRQEEYYDVWLVRGVSESESSLRDSYDYKQLERFCGLLDKLLVDGKRQWNNEEQFQKNALNSFTFSNRPTKSEEIVGYSFMGLYLGGLITWIIMFIWWLVQVES